MIFRNALELAAFVLFASALIGMVISALMRQWYDEKARFLSMIIKAAGDTMIRMSKRNDEGSRTEQGG